MERTGDWQRRGPPQCLGWRRTSGEHSAGGVSSAEVSSLQQQGALALALERSREWVHAAWERGLVVPRERGRALLPSKSSHFAAARCCPPKTIISIIHKMSYLGVSYIINSTLLA